MGAGFGKIGPYFAVLEILFLILLFGFLVGEKELVKDFEDREERAELHEDGTHHVEKGQHL